MFQVGDKVRIKSLDWYNKNQINGTVKTQKNFIKSMREYCGMETVITKVEYNYYRLKVDNGNFSWDEEMFDPVDIGCDSEKHKYNYLSKDEAVGLLFNTKTMIQNPAQSEQIQTFLFKLGFSWLSGSKKIYSTEKPFLFFSQYGKITHSDSYKHFNEKKYRFITPMEILDMKITEEPKTWKNITEISGYKPSEDGKIIKVEHTFEPYRNLNVAKSEKYVKAVLAINKISHLKHYYGGELSDEDFNNTDKIKFYIGYNIEEEEFTVSASQRYISNRILSFNSLQNAKDFIKYNRELLKEFFMI